MVSNKTFENIHVVDIIIPTYNNYISLVKTLRSLEQQTVSNFFVHICVDGSSKEIEEQLPLEGLSFDHQILTHPNNEHRGRNATRNLAIPFIKGSYIITIDSDSIASNTLIEEHLNVVNENTISVGMFTYTNANTNIWAKYLSTRGNSTLTNVDTIPFYYFKTGNVCFPASFFIQLGGQDENMIHYGGGDTEFSIRMNKTYRPTYVSNSKAIVYSEMDKDVTTALAQFFEFGSINLPYIIKKHPDEKEIFSIKTILFTPFYFQVLQIPFATMFTPILSIFPSVLQVKLLHLCVASQIARGYKSTVT